MSLLCAECILQLLEGIYVPTTLCELFMRQPILLIC